MSDPQDVKTVSESRDAVPIALPGPPVGTVSAREGYRLWAASYDAEPNSLLALESRILAPWLPEVHGKVVLDVACGTGRWLERVLQRDPQQGVGVDFSAPMLARAGLKPPLRGKLVQGDCLSLPFRRGFADIVICSFVAGYIDDLRAFAAELARITRPGADVFVTDVHPTALQQGWRRTFHHGGGVVEIRSVAHTLKGIHTAFEGFELLRRQEACLGEPERQIFLDVGKGHLFENAAREPAIFACHFRKVMASSFFTVPRIFSGVTACGLAEHSFLRTLKLTGACVATDGRTAHQAEIEISRGRIQSLNPSPPDRQRARSGGTLTIDLTGYLVLPGLINAHDHLEFNLFPRLGKGPHANAEQWAQRIYHPEQSPVREFREVPKSVRLWWGAIKNLLSGVTTVCHHNPYQPEVFDEGFPVRVIRRFGWAHSLGLEKNVVGAFLATPPDDPFVIHLGEGTDARSRDEIFALDRLGALDSRTVIVHGVGLDAAGHALIQKRRAGLVWCPTSNLFTLGRTLAHEVVDRNPRVALGNDSALTAEGDLLDELRAAYRHTSLPAEELYSMVTVRAAELLRLREGEGAIAVGKVADLVAIRDTGMPPAQVLLGASFRSIELVLLGGQPTLLSPAMAERWPPELSEGVNPLCVEDEVRWVRGPVPSLLQQAGEKLGSGLRLAGKRIGAG